MAAALSGCTYAFDEFLPQPTDAATVDSGVFQSADTFVDTSAADTAEAADDTFVAETLDDTFVADTAVLDTAIADIGESDACTCIKTAGPKCKEWSPPGCGD
jgi:hypothetical protein